MTTGETIQVATGSAQQHYPDVVYLTEAGRYVVAWRDNRNSSTSGYDVYGQLVSPAGTLDRSNYVIAGETQNEHIPRLTVDDSGAALVVWARDNGGESGYDLYGRRLGSDGLPASDSFPILEADGNQHSLTVAGDGSGGYLVTWQDNRNGDWDVYGTVYESITTYSYDPLLGRLASVTSSTGERVEYVHDGDGNRVKRVEGGLVTVYVGKYYERQGNTVTKYYYANGQRVAMREGGVVYYLHGDHLGSTSLTTDGNGTEVARQLYYPYGEERWSSGTLATDYQFTGQRREQGIGLYDYNARFYDPALGRFVSADTIVPNPGNPQDLNRYSYVRNSPLNYRDPSGHAVDMRIGGGRRNIPSPPVQDDDPPDDFESSFVDPLSKLLRPDVVGWRIEGSGGNILGGDINLDLVFNCRDQETGEYIGLLSAMLNYEENMDFLVTVGGQAITEGIGVTTGPLVAYNAKTNEDLEKFGIQLGVTGEAVFGTEVNLTIPTDGNTWEVYLGFGGGGEVSAGGGLSWTFNVTDRVISFVEEYLIPGE